MIEGAINLARVHVKIFRLEKNGGGFREIYNPSKKLKPIQYWLIHKIFNNISIDDSAMAFRKNTSILHNAKLHRNSKFFLRMDCKNFFPSISFQDLIPIVKHWHSVFHPEWDFDFCAEELIRKACFYKNDKLAIGYPSSPIISNIVMVDFDSKVKMIISNKKFGNVVYTRYADDIVLSTDRRGACRALKGEIDSLILNTQSPNIRINTLKTRFGSSASGSATVTGLKICGDGHITIHRKQKDHIRLLLSLYSKDKLINSEHSSLLGHLSYCRHVDPSFYSKLAKKYFKEIHSLQTIS